MKTLVVICLEMLFFIGSAQKIKPCEEWQTDFIQVEPKITDGERIDKYVQQKLMGDTSLREMATCMVGLRIYANCNGEFSYERQTYRNNPALNRQCKLLLKKTESILNNVTTLAPATIAGKQKDFAFKLVVRIKKDGEPVAEVLY